MVMWWLSSMAYKHHKNTVSCLTAVHLKRCSYLITGSFDGYVGVWDITKRRSVKPALEYMFQANKPKAVSAALGGDAADASKSFLLAASGDAEILAVAPLEADEDKAKGFFTAGNDCNIKVRIACVCGRSLLATFARVFT